MNFSVYKNRLSQVSARLHLMVFLVFGLMVANVSLTGILWYSFKTQRIEVTPFFANGGYIKSPTMVDSNYLTLMSENFIYARLNVTPETVKANHERLLHFVDSASYAPLLNQLQKESSLIQKKKISSTFHITNLKANSSALTAEIQGILKRYVGIKPVQESQVTYNLTYRYHDGHISIKSFTHLKEKKHA